MKAEGEQTLGLDILGLILQQVVWLLGVEKFHGTANEAWLENLRGFCWVYQLNEGFSVGRFFGNHIFACSMQEVKFVSQKFMVTTGLQFNWGIVEIQIKEFTESTEFVLIPGKEN